MYRDYTGPQMWLICLVSLSVPPPRFRRQKYQPGAVESIIEEMTTIVHVKPRPPLKTFRNRSEDVDIYEDDTKDDIPTIKYVLTMSSAHLS